ncbi:hypothetical protein [Butyrivibrio sp. AE3009]|nr:hypothetical protein [Butyrivibrio sp. AE3009]
MRRLLERDWEKEVLGRGGGVVVAGRQDNRGRRRGSSGCRETG